MYKKNLIYLITIFLGVLEQIANILAFMIPIRAIKIIDRGEVIPQIKKLLSIFNIDIKNNFDQYLFLSILFLLLVIGIILLNMIKNELIKKIKIRKLQKIFKNSKEKEISYQYLIGKLVEIEEFVNFRTTLIYSSILLVFVTKYDYQISIIIILNCIFNYIFRKKINDSSKLKISNDDSYSIKNFIEILKKEYKSVRIKSSLKPFINTFTMFCIMTSIFLREQITISIIFIFLIRIYLNKINDVIIKIADNKVFLNSILDQIKIKNLKKFI